MIPSLNGLARPAPALTGLARGALAILAAVIVGLALVQLLLGPPLGDLQALAIAMLGSAAITVVVGGMFVRTLDRRAATTLRTRIALGSLIGALVGLLNVLIVARQMFVSTTHDLQLLAALVVFSSLVSLGFSGWVAVRIARQLDAVGRRIRGLAAGDYEARVDPVGADEISRQARDLNELARLLQASAEARALLDRQRRDFTIAISHDLRTPLASIRAVVEALADGVVTEPEEVARYHLSARREVERLARMIDDLFELSRIEAGALTLERRPVSLSEVAAEVTDGMQARAAAAGIALSLDTPELLPPIALDGALLARAVGNLVANALEHTPPEGAIVVSARRLGAMHRLSVSDSGGGVDPGSRERIWEPFFRADPSRKRSGRAEGIGLGLAIVRGIAEAHGGRAGLASDGAGSTFTIDLPVGDLPVGDLPVGDLPVDDLLVDDLPPGGLAGDAAAEA